MDDLIKEFNCKYMQNQDALDNIDRLFSVLCCVIEIDIDMYKSGLVFVRSCDE